jgi:hypothetical protein
VILDFAAPGQLRLQGGLKHARTAGINLLDMLSFSSLAILLAPDVPAVCGLASADLVKAITR